MPGFNDIDRLKAEYKKRDAVPLKRYRYSHKDRANAFLLEQRSNCVFDLLGLKEQNPLEDQKILEIGCGTGGVLEELLEYGADPGSIFGIDLIASRLRLAHELLPTIDLINGDGQKLPFPTASFDLCLQFTAFSSILDNEIKQQMAKEMLRMLRPGGAILWYDFWLNPLNKQTRGVGLMEIRRLFPGCTYQVRKITLAPPIARILLPFSIKMATLLEKMKILNSHYLVLITPPEVIK